MRITNWPSAASPQPRTRATPQWAPSTTEYPGKWSVSSDPVYSVLLKCGLVIDLCWKVLLHNKYFSIAPHYHGNAKILCSAGLQAWSCQTWVTLLLCLAGSSCARPCCPTPSCWSRSPSACSPGPSPPSLPTSSSGSTPSPSTWSTFWSGSCLTGYWSTWCR